MNVRIEPRKATNKGYIFWGIMHGVCFKKGVAGAMLKQEIRFVVKKKNGIVTHIGKSHIFHPRIRFSGGSINWYDDSRLARGRKNE